MTTENSTTQAPAATLTEQELWKAFLTMTIERSTNFNGVSRSVERYKPEDSVTEPGEHGWMENFNDSIAASIEFSDETEETLDCWITDLECYLEQLKRVREDFRTLKATTIIMPEEPSHDADPATLDAWEHAAIEAEENPRFSLPVIDAGEAA
ncbi:hypothetical protein [Sinorhizobium meliloti]|uniref:hypothetical protein n=1 Tax=Rhizobium meliloti TaxID=382 RepID=UPI000B4A1B23|nr:hypothetical protein [Sinorhizobium meliloti]ASP68313.1 hypothetical protein CDO29_28085 [Sinorhizobium meliloti]MQX00660.1 hypothetical protein [Sinorhizobium meliloti]RVK54285.1 hypothetical protein CN160_04620 [Sinorhizobium meliloti]